MNLFSRFWYILFGLILFSFQTHAARNENSTGYNFGTITQTQSSSAVYIAQDGTLGSISGANQNGNLSSGTISLVGNRENSLRHFERIKIAATQLTFPVVVEGCSAELIVDVSNVQQTDLARPGQIGCTSTLSKNLTLNFGGALKLSGFCQAGTYSGSVNIPHTSEDCVTSIWDTCNVNTATCSSLQEATFDLHYEFSIALIISLEKGNDLNFGTMISPSSQAVVTLSPDGRREGAGMLFFNNTDNLPSAGMFKISSKAEAVPATLILPQSAVITSGGNSMTVSNFTAQYSGSGAMASGASFVVNKGDGTIYIGANLLIPANTPAGDYSGNYTITISY